MPVGPTAGPIGGPPLADPPVTRALTTILFVLLILLVINFYLNLKFKTSNLKAKKHKDNAKFLQFIHSNIFFILKPYYSYVLSPSKTDFELSKVLNEVNLKNFLKFNNCCRYEFIYLINDIII